MLKYKKFKKYILLIKEYSSRDEKITELMDTEGFINYSGKAVTAIVELLEVLMNDTSNQWIQYWLWECNFGKDSTDEQVIDKNGQMVPFRSIRDLYTVLIWKL